MIQYKTFFEKFVADEKYAGLTTWLAKNTRPELREMLNKFSQVSGISWDENDPNTWQTLVDTVMPEVQKMAIQKYGWTVQLYFWETELDWENCITVEWRKIGKYELDSNGGIFHHITTCNNLERIKRNGLLAKARYDSSISYVPSVFLIKGHGHGAHDPWRVVSSVKGGKSSITPPPAERPEDCVIVVTVELPDKYKVYKDPDSMYAVFVMKNIPPQYIIDIEKREGNPSTRYWE